MSSVEHYVTLFDRNFVPSGLALHASMLEHAGDFKLWILCMDDASYDQLNRLTLERTALIRLTEVETPELLAIKASRSRGEYCWTITPFTHGFVFAREPTAERVTYLDADLCFFANPIGLLEELRESRKHVLITDHAAAKEYDLSWKVGRFCVHFLCMRNTEAARKVSAWWQARCLEWCFHRHEDGKFGDQKYLDHWPSLFASEVHILKQTDQTLGPWNVRSVFERRGFFAPTFYHFHALRIIAPNKAMLYTGYRIGEPGMELYRAYLDRLRLGIARLAELGVETPCLPGVTLRDHLKTLKNRLLGRYAEHAL